ncbi:MAG: endolytic transglycosylase MltG [Clostridiales bacterium]|nr:endolytic transglycosylase MltG [Clostridiales bacterium]
MLYLPAGPICSLGRDALTAALNPEESVVENTNTEPVFQATKPA